MSESRKRPYVKRNEAYWNRKSAPVASPVVVNTVAAAPAVTPQPFPDIEYGNTQVLTASSREALANCGPGPGPSYRGSQTNNGLADPAAFQNIRALPSTYVGYTGNRSYAGMQEPIMLCMQAWGGVPVVRNAIEVAVEFSSQPLWFKSDNQTVQTFFEEWWKIIQGNRLVEQSMREYYRSGNVFFYTFHGKFGPAYYKNFQRAFGSKENRIPIRYELLNPSNVFVPTGLTFPYTYVRLLSTYELERLKHPITEQDKQAFNDLPKMVKDQIRAGDTFPMGVWLPMDATRLRFFFYKKQDYEPLAIPMVWPVLPDVEWKLTLKKMDMELARKIEQAILVVTHGEKPDQYNGGNGINQNNMARLQAFFTNQSILRVLVADYTTKVEWAIPDVQGILGPEKYQIVDHDIREGLQSILTGDDKFANAQIKAKIFIQRLEEGQNRFLNDFLLTEIQSICDKMGFRNVPLVGFQKIDLSDETVMARVITQMGQIGILTAEQVVKAIDTGILPDSTEMKRGQEAYKKDREDGLYEPLIGGQKDEEAAGPNGRPGGSGTKQSTKKISPIGTSTGSEEPQRVAFSMKGYADCLKASQDLHEQVVKALCKRYKIKQLDEGQMTVAGLLTKNIVTTQPVAGWRKAIAKTLDAPTEVSPEIAAEVDQLQLDYSVDAFDAALLRHCRTTAPE